MTDSYEAIHLDREADGLAVLTLSRPASLNALNAKLVDELHALVDRLTEAPSIRVVILHGAGRAF